MMKLTGLVVGLLLLASHALAQPPTEVTPEGDISIGIGQIKVFRFDQPIIRVDVITEGVVRAMPQSDRQISLTGLTAGATQLYVYAHDGKRIYDASVTVTPETGHQVKIYGAGKNDDINAGFISIYCNEFGCGRPDKDLPVPQITVERISRGPKDR